MPDPDSTPQPIPKLRVAEKALKQMHGCPTQCVLVEGKSCDPVGTYIRVPADLKEHPKVRGHTYLCEPCLKLIREEVDFERRVQREAKANIRGRQKAAKREARDAARAAEADLAAAYQDILDIQKKERELEVALERKRLAVGSAEAQVAEKEDALRRSRARLQQSRAALASTREELGAMPEAPDPADQLLALQAAKGRADAAWKATTPSATKKHRDAPLHKRVIKLLRRNPNETVVPA